MRPMAGLLALFLLIVAVRLAVWGQPVTGGAAAMALGFVLIVSFLLGRAVTKLGLPTISGYILVGMLFGPHLLGRLHPAVAVLGQDAVAGLRLLDAVALGLIALTAGGELRLTAVREHAVTIGQVLVGQVVLTFVGVTLAVLALRDVFPSLSSLPPMLGMVAALLFGVTATANSPATAVAVIQEYRSRGPMTDVVLAVTVVKDVVVISLFTVLLAVVLLLVHPGVAMGTDFLLNLGWEVAGSIGAGVVLGWLVAQYQERVGDELPLLVLGVAFSAVAVLPELHLSGLLACMVAGFFIENFSDHGEALVQAIERHALPVYVIFFTIAGASLDLRALLDTWPLALFLVVVRLGLTVMGTNLGAALSKAPGSVVKHAWSGFVAQAGVTLGFAILIEQRLPEIGSLVKTVILAVIAVNQIVGPVLFRIGLHLAREIPSGKA